MRMPTTTSTAEPAPACHAAHVIRNGKTKAGSPNFLCRCCKRRFVARPGREPITEERRDLVRRLLLEQLSLRAIARAARVSRTWLQGFVNDLYRDQAPWEPGPLKKSRAG